MGLPGLPAPPNETARDQRVGQHGTFRFPFASLGAAVERAAGTTQRAHRDPRRAGYGWTVLLGPGHYNEPMSISIPLTLANADSAGGRAVIG